MSIRGLRNSHAVKEEAQELQLKGHTSEDEDQRPISCCFLSLHSTRNRSRISPMKMEVETTKRPHPLKTGANRAGPDNTLGKKRCKRKKEAVEDINDHSEVQSSTVMERAEVVQANIGPEYPNFMKLMLRSHVTKGFWLGLPMEFCRLHMPKHDETILLEGENGEDYKTNFLAEKGGLSGGWRGFSIAHELLEGDAVVFHLVQPFKFKVYIIRANGLGEVNGALDLLNLDSCASETAIESCKENDFKRSRKANESHQVPLSEDILQETIESEQGVMVMNSSLAPVTDESENGSEFLTSEDMEDFKISNSFVDFQNFNIRVDGLMLDMQLSKHLQAKYYELCYTRKSYLHKNLLKGINHKLAAGIICETINIADAIRACKLSTSLHDLEIWGKTLEALELLGMDVRFLRDRLERLVSLVLGSTEKEESKRCAEAKCELDHAEEEERSLQLKLLKSKQARSRLEQEIEALKLNVQRYELMFQEEVNAPW